MEYSSSLVKVASPKLKEMAEHTLQRIKSAREREKKRIIEAEVAMLNNGFWHKLYRKLFGYADFTFEHAEIMLKNDCYSFYYHDIPILYRATEDVCNRILNACKYADEIYISTEDLNSIRER